MRFLVVKELTRTTVTAGVTALAVTVVGALLMWALFGPLGAAVLLTVLTVLGRLLVKAARGQ
jgi:hypothetical protein